MFFNDQKLLMELFFQVGFFVGGVASLESSEIAGIAVTFSVISVVLFIFLLIFLVRQRLCGKLIPNPSNANKPTVTVVGKSNGTASNKVHIPSKVHTIKQTLLCCHSNKSIFFFVGSQNKRGPLAFCP